MDAVPLSSTVSATDVEVAVTVGALDTLPPDTANSTIQWGAGGG
jgi:hypothetical protein